MMASRNLRQVNVLGVKVDDLSMDQATDLVVGWLKTGGKHYIVTPNPEFVMAAQGDPEFKKVLNGADLSIPDGVGLKIGSDLESNIPGVDFVERLCKEASDLGFTTGFLGGRSGVAKRAAECLQKKYPGLKVAFAEDGPEVDTDGEQVSSDPLDTKYLIPNTDLLFVAFGQVKQEKWIAKNLDSIPVKVAMGVGGSFDEISGRVLKVPSWVQKIGLKWLARLILQPWRIKRQMVLVKYLWLVTCNKKMLK